MREKCLKIIFAIVIMLGILATSCYATSTKKQTSQNEITEEMVQTMVDEKVNTAIQGAVTQIQTNQTTEVAEGEEKTNGLGLVAAAIATGLACIGSGIAVAVVASSAVGAISENPSLLGKTIIFAGLAEGIAIYGLIISIMILNKI